MDQVPGIQSTTVDKSYSYRYLVSYTYLLARGPYCCTELSGCQFYVKLKDDCPHVRNGVSRGYYVALCRWRTNTMNRTSYRVVRPYQNNLKNFVRRHDQVRTHHQEIPCIYDDGTWDGRNRLWRLWEMGRIDGEKEVFYHKCSRAMRIFNF